MPSNKNKEMLEEAKGALQDSSGMLVVDFRGLNVRDAQKVRRQLREANALMHVFKNRIVKLALAEEKMPEIDDMLEGTSAFVFYESDPVAAAKVLKQTAKDIETFELKGGIADGSVISKDEIVALADLPSREELLAKLLGTISAPLSNMARVLNAPAQKFATALEQVVEQKKAA